MAYLLLAAAQAVGLVLIPFSAAGLWVQLGALGLFAWWTSFHPVGVIPVIVLVGLGLASEAIRLMVGAIRIPGGTRRRLGVSGVAGGLAGAATGIVLPLLGTMFGALLGAATGTLIGASTMHNEADARSSVFASAVAMALCTATGLVVAIFTLLIVVR